MANLPRLLHWNKIFFILIACILLARGVLTAILWYEYIIFSSSKEVNKGWTFIEAITDPISYLPYWWDHEKNQFYQTLLFPGCENGLSGALCDIQTTDNKVYRVKIDENLNWSDGTPFTIDDVIFSYQDIIVSNFWDQPYLSKYQDIVISVSEDEPDVLVITFPTASENNRLFFRFPIIPLHIIQDYTLKDYVTNFAVNPVTIWCAALQNSKDEESIIFNLSSCPNTNINYYQIKSFANLEDLQKSVLKKNPMVGFYYGNIESDHYRLLQIQDNNYMSLFFNTKSTKLTPRIQRSIGGFINYHLWEKEHTGYLSPYEWLFNNYVTTGANLVPYIEEKNPYLTYDKSLLEQWGVKELPNVFTIDWAKRKYAFYLNSTTEQEHTFTLETTDPVTNIKWISNKSARGLVIKSENNNKKHTITFTIGAEQQVQEWLNTFTINGTVLGKSQQIATIDLYFLGRTSTQTGENNLNKIKIITLDNKISNYIRVQLQDIFEDNGVQHLFEFVVYNNQEKFLEAIKIKDYDMVLTSMQIRWLDDIYRIISSNNLEVNPSGYNNPVLNQFLLDNNRTQARNVIGSDMPFFIVGQLMKPYRLRNDINFEYEGKYTEATLKEMILRHISLVSHSSLQASKLFKKDNFNEFLQTIRKSRSSIQNDNIQTQEEQPIQKQKQIEEIVPEQDKEIIQE